MMCGARWVLVLVGAGAVKDVRREVGAGGFGRSADGGPCQVVGSLAVPLAVATCQARRQNKPLPLLGLLAAPPRLPGRWRFSTWCPLKGVHEDRAAVHIVMELCAGGELFQRIVSKGTFSEADAARHFRTMVEMVSGCLCHGQGGRQLACCVGGSGGPSGLRSCQPAACAAAQAACLNHLRCAQSAHPASHSQSTIANNKLLLRRWRTCTRWG